MAAWAAALIGSGTSKSGWPMLRVTGSLRLRANSKTLRMPEDSMCLMRSAIQRSGSRPGAMRRSPGGGAATPMSVVAGLPDGNLVVVQRPFAHEANPVGPNAVDDQRGVVEAAEVLAQQRVG